MTLSHIRIIGSGLIGTSIGLALRAHGVSVTMVDLDPQAEKLAQDLMGGEPACAAPIDLTIVATPVSTISKVILRENSSNINMKFMDVASVKNKVKVEVSSLGLDSSSFLPSHPMAGREVGGPQSARADLFQDRAWVYDPDGVSPELLDMGVEVMQICGASPVALPAPEHDQAVALISHLPQIAASLVAGELDQAQPGWLDLAGAGLRDTTRIAASDAGLWSEIISSNGGALLPLLQSMVAKLSALIEEIENPEAIREFITRGNQGRAAIPGKHGGAARNYTLLPVVIEDKAGQLAALFEECARALVNVEDLTIEHSPEQFTGLITLALSSGDAETLYHHLLAAGWKVHAPRN